MSIVKLFTLTVLPSAIATALYIGVGIYVQAVPSLLLFFIAAMFTMFPFELWVIASANKREHGKYGLQAAFANHEPMEWWKILLWGLVLFGFAGIVSATIAPLENRLTSGLSQKLYSVLPAYFDWNDFGQMKQYPRGILVFTCVFYILMNALIYPIIEELYFRGYLTNRLERYGILAPVIVAIAFSLYHWWLPFSNIFRICAFAPAAVIGYRKKNIYIPMVFHCLCNLFSSVSFIVSLMG